MEPILNVFYRQKAQFNKAETNVTLSSCLFVSFLAVCLYKAVTYIDRRVSKESSQCQCLIQQDTAGSFSLMLNKGLKLK